MHFETRVKDQVLACGRRLRLRLARPLLLAGRARRPRHPYIFRLSHYQTGPGLGLGPDDRPFRRCRRADRLPRQTDRRHRWNLQMPVLPHDRSQRRSSIGRAPRRTTGRSAANAATAPAEITSGRSTAKLPDPAIINPAEATAEGRLRLCGQCHSNHQQSSLPRTDPFWLRFQGTPSPGAAATPRATAHFDCMTCHDPHHDTDRSAGILQRPLPDLPFRRTAREDQRPLRETSDPPTDRAVRRLGLPGQPGRLAASAATCRRSRVPPCTPTSPTTIYASIR